MSEPRQFPGRIIKAGEENGGIVKASKPRLNDVLGLSGAQALGIDNPNFGPKMTQVVIFSQSRNVDCRGTPLKADGEIGGVARKILLGAGSLPVADQPADDLLRVVLEVAKAEDAAGIREERPPFNRGALVDEYPMRTGLKLTPGADGFAWCEDAAGADLLQCVKDDFDAFPERGAWLKTLCARLWRP